MSFSQYTNKSIGQVFDELKTSAGGLSDKEAGLRQKQYGLNEIATKGTGVFDILRRQFTSPFFYLLLAAGLVAFFIGEKIDGTIIIIFIAINVLLGFVQEFKAERSVALLENFIPQNVKVLRHGEPEVVEKKELVPGDMLVLTAGDIVPAEMRVLSFQDLLVDESVLTGEALPVQKTGDALPKAEKEFFKSRNILFAGTSVAHGTVHGIVVGTGKDTALGGIIQLTAQKRPASTYEKDIMYFCRLTLKIVLVTVAVLFALNLLIKGSDNFFDFTLFCVALIVSILPEALPTVVVLALSRGSLKLAHANVVVKRLSSIEDLGNIEILCADKTGTLTENAMSLEKIISSDKDLALTYALLQAKPQSKNLKKANPFDAAFFARASYHVLQELKKYTLVFENSFDSFKMMTSYVAQDQRQKQVLIAKGAPEVIFKLCNKFGGNFDRKELQEDIDREGLDGKRVLAIAYKKVPVAIHKDQWSGLLKKEEKGMTFLGYFVFEDPLKSTAGEAIRLAKKMGVQVKIVTGDSKEVSGYVAKKVGLITSYDKVILGEDLEKLFTDDFDEACEENVVFARISPKTKHNIIKSLQKRYEVGFLGEGINDVAALKIANVGIVVAEAADISKEAADVVLLNKDLRVIVNGIKHGRGIFSNINKYIRSTLISNFGNFYSIAAISLFVPFLPMLPIQILLGNLLTDFPLISIVTDSVDVPELRKPKAYRLHMMLPLIIALALVSTLFDFIFFLIFFRQEPGTIQTLWFITSVLTELLLIFIIRTRYVFWKAKKPSILLIGLTIVAAATALVLPMLTFGHNYFRFAQVSFSGVALVVVLVVAYIAASELVKLVYFHYFTRHEHGTGALPQ